jgi:DNA-binding MarR family transcriptional regulator
MNQTDKQKLLALRQQNIGRMFQRAARAYSELALEKLHAQGHEGLTLFHTALISNLDIEGTHLKVLAERAGMSKQAMGQVADELEKRGYVKAVTDSKDKRATLVTFTKLEIERSYSAKLGKAGMKQLWRLLEKLLQGQ